MTRLKRFRADLLTVGAGAVGMIVAGQIYSLIAGGNCTTLCQPQVAGSLGAVTGLLVAILGRWE